MAEAAATLGEGLGAPAPPAVRDEDFRQALEQTLALVARDEQVAPALAATAMRVRFEFPDVGLVLNLATELEGEIRWSFAERPGWEPQLELRMDSGVANRFLQGRESIAVAIARGRARCRGSARVAIRCLPATRLLRAPYRGVIEDRFPDLLAGD